VKKTIILGAPLYFETTAYQINVLMIGALNNTPLTAANGILSIISDISISISGSLADVNNVFIGNSAGEGDNKRVKEFIKATF